MLAEWPPPPLNGPNPGLIFWTSSPDLQAALVLGSTITSARGTVIAAEVAVKNMYHEERELLPAADGTHGKEGLLPGAGGMSSPPGPGSSLVYWRR